MSLTPDHLAIDLLASPAAAGLARTLLEPRLNKWGASHILDDAFLVSSELINNAVNETPGAQIRFRLGRDAPYVSIAVWDSSPRTPQVRPLQNVTLETLDLSPESWDDNGGWGLALVISLSAECGCTRDPRGGKWVWARLKF
ncbi:ATP-binding protein [Thermomonospora cellulosilytica]|uniref:Histidine kinase/HSP90-like ATPase domain-containing protein n=1 Tax=Thermomonospora cellulosilytica TaxID=1411118 RepID=A0A7W3MVM5_9ACTN|nr:ATP-binding protein [Thermomonospora cellulosilytica]MBA9002706.1 hypothetical protein [Thermomonospora cellulosilytica]